MKTNELSREVIKTLDSMKVKHILQYDVKHLCNFTDVLIIGTGTSNTHVNKSTTELTHRMKQLGHPPLNVEGENYNEWVLIDFGDIVVHIMQEETRQFYQLEKLWSTDLDKKHDAP